MGELHFWKSCFEEFNGEDMLCKWVQACRRATFLNLKAAKVWTVIAVNTFHDMLSNSKLHSFLYKGDTMNLRSSVQFIYLFHIHTKENIHLIISKTKLQGEWLQAFK